MGVWIEIMRKLGFRIKWVVTPCVGVWIEILTAKISSSVLPVTPCVGVWIEILWGQKLGLRPLGHSLCGSVD